MLLILLKLLNKKLSEKNSVNPRLVTKLINYLYMNSNIFRKSKILGELEKILNEEWRSEETILKEAGK